MRTEGYSTSCPLIGAGETVEIQIASFGDEDAKRFNPFATKIEKLRIYAKTPNGEAPYVA